MPRNLIPSTAALIIALAGTVVLAQPQSEADLPAAPAATPIRPVADTDRPLVQIAILLDNSGSMKGLIDQAKSELWRVVNELTTARQNGKQPRLQVGLYSYGNPPPQKLSALTDDLDRVSEALFAVPIRGGSEYCGLVIETATRELAWSTNHNDLKIIFIAGNEPFTQGPVEYQTACQQAIERGIIVNTIHCGNGIPDGLRNGALLADGKAMSINQNTQVVHIDAPQDQEIARLGNELNSTYIAFGKVAVEGKLRQSAQDTNAAAQSLGSSVQRAVSKANSYYQNRTWDLVDAVNDGSVELAKVKEEDLPENMRRMKVAERETHVKKQAVERKRIQQRINTLNAERNKYVAAKRQEAATESGLNTLDKAFIEAIRSQASKKSFAFTGEKQQ